MNPTVEAVKELSKERMRQLVMALEFVPRERLQWRMTECGKSPMEIYLECGGNLLMNAKILRGEAVGSRKTPEAFLPEAKSFPDLQGARAMMQEYLQEFVSALDNLDESRMGEKVELPWGQTMTVREFIGRTASHACYYCGQLTYLQSLLGGGEARRV